MIFAIIPILLQIICVIHVIRTHRPFVWIYLIVFLPLVGCIVYFILEIVPEIAGHSKTREMGSAVLNTVAPTRRLKELEDQLALSNTVKNKLDLADEYMQCGMYLKAVDLYRDCLQGIYKDDMKIMNSLGTALAASEQYDEALEMFHKIRSMDNSPLTKESWLLLAQTLEKKGNMDEARIEYEALLASRDDLEVMYSYGKFLQNIGDKQKACDIFNEILMMGKQSPKFSRKFVSKWTSLAAREIGK